MMSITATRSVAVTGATGFIGSAVRRTAPPDARVRILTRQSVDPAHGREVALAVDLAAERVDPDIFAGVAAVIHCASYIGQDADRCYEVNAAGSQRLVSAAQAAGVERIIYVSTSGVYGPGPHRGAGEGLPTSPSSPLSASRREAERYVLDAGGIVVRPHLLYGVGDKHVIPRLLGAVTALGGTPEGGRSRVSILNVDRLAHQLWWLATQSGRSLRGVVFNAASGPPSRLRDVLEECAAHLPWQMLTTSLDGSEVEARGPSLGLSAHQIRMLTADDYYSSRLESLRPWRLGPFRLDSRSTDWYRQQCRCRR